MDNYSYNQIKRMEQEATRRAREYNSRAKPPENVMQSHTKSHENGQKMAENRSKIHENHGQNTNFEPKKPQKRDSFSFLNALDLKKLIGENSEQAMLLLLILILSNDNTCDEYLLYALIYIML